MLTAALLMTSSHSEGTLDEPINFAVPQSTYAILTGDERTNELAIAQATAASSSTAGAVTSTVVADCWDVTIRPSKRIAGVESFPSNASAAPATVARWYTVTVSLSESTGQRRSLCGRMLADRRPLTIPLRTYYADADGDRPLRLSARIVAWRVDVGHTPLRTAPIYWTAGTIPPTGGSVIPQLPVNPELPSIVKYEANTQPGLLLLQVKVVNYKAVLTTAADALVPLVSGTFPVTVLAYEALGDPQHTQPYQVGVFDLVISPPLQPTPLVYYADAGAPFSVNLTTAVDGRRERSSGTISAAAAARAALTFSTATALPYGVILDASSGILSGKRDVLGQTREILVSASDRNGATVVLPPVILDIKAACKPRWKPAAVPTNGIKAGLAAAGDVSTPPPPSPTESFLPPAVLGRHYSYVPESSGGQQTTAYSVGGGRKLPFGLKLNVLSGEIYGVPALSGAHELTIVGRCDGNNNAGSHHGSRPTEGAQAGIVNGGPLHIRVEDCDDHTCGSEGGSCIDTTAYDGLYECDCSKGYLLTVLRHQHMHAGAVDLCRPAPVAAADTSNADTDDAAVNNGVDDSNAGGDGVGSDQSTDRADVFSDPTFRRIIIGVIITLVALLGLAVVLWVAKSQLGLLPDTKSSLDKYKDEETAGIKRGRMRVLKQPRVVNSSNITIQERIGEGHYGVCHKAQLRTDNSYSGSVNSRKERIVVCKIMHDDLAGEDIQTMNHEAMVMSQFNKNPHVLRLIGVINRDDVKTQDGKHMTLITPYCENGSLLDYLKMCMDSSVHQLTTANKFTLCVDVAKGMKYLGSVSVVHRDLAARNVLIDHEHKGVVADFGMAFFLHRKGHSPGRLYVKHQDIPLRWSAPEVLAWREFSIASDVWAFGVLVCEVFSDGTKPYVEMSNDEVHAQVPNGYRMPCPDGCPQEAHDSATALCWEKEPSDRLGFRELIERLERFASRVENAGGDEGSSWGKVEHNSFEGSGGGSGGRSSRNAALMSNSLSDAYNLSTKSAKSTSISDGSASKIKVLRRSVSEDDVANGGSNGNGSGGSGTKSAVGSAGVSSVAGGVVAKVSPADFKQTRKQRNVSGSSAGNSSNTGGYVQSLPGTPLTANTPASGAGDGTAGRFGTAPWSSYGDAIASTGLSTAQNLPSETLGHRRISMEEQLHTGGEFFKQLAHRRTSVSSNPSGAAPSGPIAKTQSAPAATFSPLPVFPATASPPLPVFPAAASPLPVFPVSHDHFGEPRPDGSGNSGSGGAGDLPQRNRGLQRLPNLTIEDTNGRIEDVGVGSLSAKERNRRNDGSWDNRLLGTIDDDCAFASEPPPHPQQSAPRMMHEGRSKSDYVELRMRYSASQTAGASSGPSMLSPAVMSALAEGMSSPAAAEAAALHTASGAEAAIAAVYPDDHEEDEMAPDGDGLPITSFYADDGEAIQPGDNMFFESIV